MAVYNEVALFSVTRPGAAGVSRLLPVKYCKLLRSIATDVRLAGNAPLPDTSVGVVWLNISQSSNSADLTFV